MEKQLIYFDEKVALEEIERRKQLTEAIKELRVAYEQLKIQEKFSKDVYIGLVEGGKIYLFELVVKNYPKTLGIPKGLPSSFSIDEYFEIIGNPLTKVKHILRYSSEQNRIEPYVVNFNGSDPAFTKAEEEAIKEKHRYYAETTEENELMQLVQDYCMTINKLDKYLKDHNGPNIPSIIEGSYSTETLTYVDFRDEGQVVSLVPNPLMFENIRRINKVNHL